MNRRSNSRRRRRRGRGSTWCRSMFRQKQRRISDGVHFAPSPDKPCLFTFLVHCSCFSCFNKTFAQNRWSLHSSSCRQHLAPQPRPLSHHHPHPPLYHPARHALPTRPPPPTLLPFSCCKRVFKRPCVTVRLQKRPQNCTRTHWSCLF